MSDRQTLIYLKFKQKFNERSLADLERIKLNLQDPELGKEEQETNLSRILFNVMADSVATAFSETLDEFLPKES